MGTFMLTRSLPADVDQRSAAQLPAREVDAMISSEGPGREIRWPVLKATPGHAHEVVLLAGGFLRLDTHFFRRTQICLGTDDCPVCQLLPSRAFYYMPAKWRANGRPVLLELSGSSASDLEQVCGLLGPGLSPGVAVAATRRACKSPIRFEAIGLVEEAKECPEVEWVTAVMAIYGFTAMRPGESLEGYRVRLRAAAVARCDRLAFELMTRGGKSPNGVRRR